MVTTQYAKAKTKWPILMNTEILGKEILQHLALEEMETKQLQNLQTFIIDQDHVAS